MSNLWIEDQFLLDLSPKEGVVPVLALSADVLTENVFIITENHRNPDQLEIDKIKDFIGKLKPNLEALQIPKNIKDFLVETEDGEILMQNPLLIKTRNQRQKYEEKMEILQSLIE